MYPAAIEDYVRPGSIDEALEALVKYDAGDAFFVAGGQSLMQALKSRLVRPRCLVDLQDIAELAGIAVNGDGVRIGPMTRYREIAAEERLHGAYQALNDAAARIGDRQVRNRGTIGGSLCWNYIAACLPPTCLGLGAELELLSSDGEKRTLSAADFIGGPLETARADNEILTAVRLPAAPKNAGSAYKKWGLLTDSLPVIGICAYLELDGGACATARLAIGGLTSGPVRAAGAERALAGVAAGDADGIAKAVAAAAAETETQDDMWADSAYRKQLIRSLGKDVVTSAFARAGA
jgi:carbon-monoxide dehydrogenase medium subunit